MADPTLAVILRRMKATREAAQQALRQTDDMDFVEGMCDVVAIKYDTRAGGGVVGSHGSPGPPDLQPVVGFEEVVCRRGKSVLGPTEGAARPGEMTIQWWMFPQEVPVHRGYQLVHQDPEYGERVYYVQDKAMLKQDENGTPHHWRVPTQDRPLN